MKTYITDYEKYCFLCGRPASEMHHLVYSGALRKLADDDGLFVPICRDCHNQIHNIGIAGKLSKVVGQLVYELNENAHKGDIQDAREKFRKRYGRSYL
jgi:hypothetical protein